MTTQYKPDHIGIGEMLRAPFMEGTMVIFAEGIKAYAEAISPIDEKGPHPGRYKASFHVRHHSRGGATRDRAEAIVYNDAPEALYVEFAHYGQEPYHILARAAFQRFA
jgi:hypothetical protein